MTIFCFYVFNLGATNAMYVFIMFPYCVVPFTYVTSFWFSVDSAAQTYTMFSHFFTLAIIANIVYYVRVYPGFESIGDAVNIALKIIPTYPIASAVYCDANCEELARIRALDDNKPGLEADIWHFSNLPLDMTVMCVQMLFWSFMLLLIE